MSITSERLASLVQKELAIIVNNVIKDGQIGYINLTEVKMSKDLSIATIYYTILSDDKEVLKKATEKINKMKATIRMDLAKKIKNVRKIPDLSFKYDEALAYGNHINEILSSLK